MADDPSRSPDRSVHAIADDALGTDDGVGVAKRIAAGEISAQEAVEAAIARLNAVEPQISAVVVDRFDDARAEAGRSRTGVFAGVPTAIKDNTDIAGVPTMHGTRSLPSHPAEAHAPIASQIFATGAIALAKTKLPEHGLTATTEFTQGEPARNPWNTDHSTGASSGGSAALVAAGVIPFAHANDGGGSIRIPAACCGLVGLKPSRNRLIQPEVASKLPVDIVAEGIVSRSVRDTATFLAAAEQTHVDLSLPRVGLVDAPTDDPLRIAYFTERFDGSPAHPDCIAAVETTVKTLESMGHHVDKIPSPVGAQFADDFLLYWGMAAAGLRHGGRVINGKGFDKTKLEPLTNGLAKHFRSNIRQFPAALKRLKAYAGVYEGYFNTVDLIVSPTLALPPVEIGHLALDLPFDEARVRLEEYAAFTQAQNVSGAPAISLPLGRSSTGLPIGVHFGAPMGHDRRLLELALSLEEAMPWPQVWSA